MNRVRFATLETADDNNLQGKNTIVYDINAIHDQKEEQKEI